MDAIALRIAQQVGIAVAAVMLVLDIDVRRMEGQAHLLHPVLRADLGVEPQVDRVVDDGVGQFFGAQVEAEVRDGLF